MSPPVHPPVPLVSRIDAAYLSAHDPYDSLFCLGSFWPYSRHSRESHLVKGFKECSPVSEFQPQVTRLCESYARLISSRLDGTSCDWVARVLGSTETRPDSSRPLALLEDILCGMLGAKSITHLFFKSDDRPAMRQVSQLSGPEVLSRRIRYAAGNLFVSRADVGGRVLLLDDIFNTGASMRVYAQALREFAGADSVAGANLAATRFRAGKDGHGRLQLDTAEFAADAALDTVWVEPDGVFHKSEDCSRVRDKTAAKLRFAAEKSGPPCGSCCLPPKPERRFWGLLR